MERTPLTPLDPHAAPPGERLVRLRIMLLALSVCLWGVVVFIRLVQLQVLERGSYARQAARQSERTINLDSRRGAILDRNGHDLALSVDAESIYAVPQEVEDPQRAASLLARALALDTAGRKDLQVQLTKNRAFVWVKRKADPRHARAVRDLQLPGIGFLTENRRYYPKRELASQVLGYVGLDNTGMSGIEYEFEEQIRGKAAKVTVHIDARRRPVGHTEKPSTDGNTIVLTLDETIQHAAEKELDRAMQETSSIAGVAVVMDPRTGEVLAMANRPTFNPNRFAAYGSSRWRNRVVADAYEPGSIFKIFTAAAGLQEKVVEPDEVIDCGRGSIEVAGTVINDHHVFDHLSFREVMAKSSDVGVIRVAQRLGRENFNRYLTDFGFGTATGVELPGESAGLLRPPPRWSALSLPSLSFGQEVGVTALQMTSAVAAVANGGYLMKPQIVKRIETSTGEVVKESKPVAVRRVLEPATIDTLTEILKGVVREGGTGKRAVIPGYVVAGKTGTAQKVDANGRYSMIDHVASFVGYVPASRPALVVLVSLDTPRGAANQGGDVAAPLFQRITEQALRHLAIPPDDPERSLRMVEYRPASAVVPAAYRPSAAQPPPVAAPAPVDTDGEPGLMPDLRGRSAREAALIAARRGLIVELKGSGRVRSQSPEPGTEIEAGGTCVLTLGRDVEASEGAP
jgi:cell division protein FtsI (penicillin-binding protein 3)